MIGRLAELCGFGREAVGTYTRNGLLSPERPAVPARVVEAYRDVVFVEEVPRNQTGKVDRSRLP
uniref:hypothetical protein n=1 Tax=Nonomuraea pusilla TaxID=46177 RepID=UPI0006E394AA|nr:hypothetical protein [Nonomuraea pusilla]